MPKKGLVALGAAVGLAAIVVVAAAALGGGSSSGGPGESERQPSNGAQPLGVPLQPLAVAGGTLDSAEAPQAPDSEAGGASSGMAYGTGGDARIPATGGTAGGAALPLPQTLDRKIIRTATLTLTIEDVLDGVQRVESIAGAAGGFVSASSVFVEDPGEGDEDRRQTATVTIRVPAEAYGSVMGQLRGIAKEVKSEASEASEVTEEYTDLEARLRNLQGVEAQLLELLTKAGTIPDILTVQDRLNSVRLEMEQVQGRINLLDSLTDLATITVELAPPVAPAQEPAGEQGWAQEAWENAWEASQDALEVMGTAAITAGVVLAWLAVPGLALLLGWRLLGPKKQGSSQT